MHALSDQSVSMMQRPARNGRGAWPGRERRSTPRLQTGSASGPANRQSPQWHGRGLLSGRTRPSRTDASLAGAGGFALIRACVCKWPAPLAWIFIGRKSTYAAAARKCNRRHLAVTPSDPTLSDCRRKMGEPAPLVGWLATVLKATSTPFDPIRGWTKVLRACPAAAPERSSVRAAAARKKKAAALGRHPYWTGPLLVPTLDLGTRATGWLPDDGGKSFDPVEAARRCCAHAPLPRRNAGPLVQRLHVKEAAAPGRHQY